VEGTVLTEWKLVKDPKQASSIALAAHAQIDLYAQGPLADLELRSHRYIILVSSKELPMHSIGLDDQAGRWRHGRLLADDATSSSYTRWQL
jgi:hypothetical protein